jgi:cellulose/xylan binding protein with CBM9 domain
MHRYVHQIAWLTAGILCVACSDKKAQPTASEAPPAQATYVCHRATSAIAVDGKLDDAAWKNAEWTSDFVDVRGKQWPAPSLRTRCKLLWDDTNLYIAAEMEDPDVWGTMTGKGQHLYFENNFEVFLDWQHNARDYWELEMNPLNTTWTLQLNKPLPQGGHAIPGKELVGLKTGVDVQGTVNDPSDRDRGWTAEIAIPFSSLASDGHVPKDGEHWRMLLCRIEWSLFKDGGKYTKVPAGDQYWSWVPTGEIAFHKPDHYGELLFQR